MFFSTFRKTFCFFNSSINIIKIIEYIRIFNIINLLNIFISIKSSFILNTINRVNIKVRTCLRNPIIRNNNSRTTSVIYKSYYFHNTYRLLTFSRNTITYDFIKFSILKLFKKFFIRMNIISILIFSKIKISFRKHNLNITFSFRMLFSYRMITKFFRIRNIFFTRNLFKTYISNLSCMKTRKSLSSNTSIKY